MIWSSSSDPEIIERLRALFAAGFMDVFLVDLSVSFFGLWVGDLEDFFFMVVFLELGRELVAKRRDRGGGSN